MISHSILFLLSLSLSLSLSKECVGSQDHDSVCMSNQTHAAEKRVRGVAGHDSVCTSGFAHTGGGVIASNLPWSMASYTVRTKSIISAAMLKPAK